MRIATVGAMRIHIGRNPLASMASCSALPLPAKTSVLLFSDIILHVFIP